MSKENELLSTATARSTLVSGIRWSSEIGFGILVAFQVVFRLFGIQKLIEKRLGEEVGRALTTGLHVFSAVGLIFSLVAPVVLLAKATEAAPDPLEGLRSAVGRQLPFMAIVVFLFVPWLLGDVFRLLGVVEQGKSMNVLFTAIWAVLVLLFVYLYSSFNNYAQALLHEKEADVDVLRFSGYTTFVVGTLFLLGYFCHGLLTEVLTDILFFNPFGLVGKWTAGLYKQLFRTKATENDVEKEDFEKKSMFGAVLALIAFFVLEAKVLEAFR